MSNSVVVSLGGSLLYEDGSIDIAYVRKISSLLLKFSKKHSIAVCVGGGHPAREYSRAIRELSGNEFMGDRAAIYATRANATVLLSALGMNAFPRVITDFDDAILALNQGKIAVGAGTMEGITTDTDALLLAERVEAKTLFNLSKIDAIYDMDPKKHSHAKKYSKMSHHELIELAAGSDERRAGTNFVFDLMACKIAARSNITLHFVDGRKLEEIEKAMEGKEHGGTLVRD